MNTTGFGNVQCEDAGTANHISSLTVFDGLHSSKLYILFIIVYLFKVVCLFAVLYVLYVLCFRVVYVLGIAVSVKLFPFV